MLPRPPVLVVSDRWQAEKQLQAVAAAAFAGGCRWFSLREKDLSEEAQVALLREIKALAAPFGAAVTVHGALAVAEAAGVGLHIGAAGDALAARRRLGPDALIGQSVHTPFEAEAAPTSALDYVIAGPAFPTASKPGYGPALGAPGLAAIVSATPLPVIAIGGLDTTTIAACHGSRIAGIAVMGGIMRAVDPAAMVGDLIMTWHETATQLPR